MNEPYENITKQIFINKWKNFLDSEQKQVESCGKKSIQHQFQMINADKKLFLKQLELVQFKKEIYSEVNEKLEKQNHALSLANFLLRNKTIAMLNTQIQRLEMEFQNYASFYDFQESELENEEERLIKLVKEKLDNNQLAIFNNLIRKIKGNPTLKTVNESYESSDLINESHLMDQIRINELDSQSKRELVIIKPLDNKNSSENLDIYNEKEAEFGTKQCLTTEIEIVTEKNQNQESYKQTPASFIGKLETNSDGDSKEHILDNKNVKKFAFDFDSLNPKYDFSFFNQTNEDNEENPQQRSGFLFICDEDRENNNLDGSFKLDKPLLDKIKNKMEIKESMKSGSSYEKKSPYDMNETKGEPKSKSSGLTDMKTSTQVSTPKRLNEIDDVFAKMDTAKILNNIKSNSARKPISRDVSNKINSQTPASKRELKFGFKYDPKFETGIPWIKPKKPTKIVPFNLSTANRANRKQS